MGTKKFTFVVSVLSAVVQFITNCESSIAGDKLHSKLLANYNVLVRPVRNDSQPIVVKYGLTLMQILNVAENENLIKTSIWQTLEWNDENLIWNPEEFDNINDIRIPPRSIWTPDIFMYNGISELSDELYQTSIVVRHNGSLTYIPPGNHETTCGFTYTNFPFDEHKCNITLGSWTYDGANIDLQLQSQEGGDFSSYIRNSDWQLRGIPGRRVATYYACCPDPYVSVIFTIHLKRRGENILMKAKLSNAYIFLTLALSCLIPPASGHKITFSILHLVNSGWPIWYYMSTFPKLITNSSDRGGPLIFYFEAVALLGALSLMANIFTVWLYHRVGKISDRIGKTLQKLSSVLFACPGHKNRQTILEIDEANTNHLLYNEKDRRSLSENDTENIELSDWLYVANIVDRCFALLFILAGIIIWITLFPNYGLEE